MSQAFVAGVGMIPFAKPDASELYDAIVWLATRRSERLASHPALRPQNGKLFRAMS